MKTFKEELGYIQELSEAIKNIDGAKIGYVNKGCFDEYPYIKVYTKYQGEEVVKALAPFGFEAEVDLYEDDDGSDGGRPIIRNIWSVKINTYTQPEVPCSSELDNEWANESI